MFSGTRFLHAYKHFKSSKVGKKESLKDVEASGTLSTESCKDKDKVKEAERFNPMARVLSLFKDETIDEIWEAVIKKGERLESSRRKAVLQYLDEHRRESPADRLKGMQKIAMEEDMSLERKPATWPFR